jgi:hypothetical protein
MTRAATKADCRGCKEAWRNDTAKPCWSLASARVVPMWRSHGRHSGVLEAVEIPNCWHNAPYVHAPRTLRLEPTR